MKVSFFKPLKIKKSLKKILKVVKNNHFFVKKNVFITKISKTFDFFSQKSKTKIVIFFLVLLYGITPIVFHFGIILASRRPLRPLLSITFPQGFRISKNIGHQTDIRRTFRLIESIGPEGRCFENLKRVNRRRRKNIISLDKSG